MFRRRHAAAIAALALAGSLAAAPQGASAATTPYVMLQVRLTGGFVPQEWLFNRLPTVVVYSDGNVYSSNVVTTMLYPGPAAPQLLRKMAKADLARIMQAAAATNLTDGKFDFGNPPIADAPDTEITWRLSQGGPTYTRSVYALGIDSFGLREDQVAARAKAQKFIEDLSSFAGTLIRTKSMPTPWVSSRWVYQAEPSLPESMSVVRTWVGPALTSPVMCGELSASQNARLRGLMPKLNQASRWLSNKKVWQVRLRPLLPHETGCSDVFR